MLEYRCPRGTQILAIGSRYLDHAYMFQEEVGKILGRRVERIAEALDRDEQFLE